MALIVPRTCTEAVTEERRVAQPLAAFRSRGAYVLLGEPGAGKTVAFKAEAEATGGTWITARDFVALSPSPAWRGHTLYIDGFDEMRAGAADGTAPLDAIRRRLDELGRPAFCLSCREADWWGASDREALASVAPAGNIDVLHLDPLTREQAALILAENHGVADPEVFLDHAAEMRLDALATNPQTLRLLATAVKNGWPDSRAKTFDAACRELAKDENAAHRRAKQERGVAIDDLLDATGRLCAVQLLAGLAGYALDAGAADAAHSEPGEIGLGVSAAERAALRSMLFVVGALDEQREPLHRSVAEYLGARYLAARIERHGLPLGRVLALMAADDGGIVSGLRGMHAWLTVHAPPAARAVLIDGDPLGVVLYGDARGFPLADKRRLFAALHREAIRNPWFRNSDWTASPFGALATPELADLFREHLAAPDRSEAQQALVDCVLDTLIHGEAQPDLADLLLTVARDGSRWLIIRIQALKALFRIKPIPAGCLELLDDIQAGRVEDSEDELAGKLLSALYPVRITVDKVFDYLWRTKQPNRLGGAYLDFWTKELAANTPPERLPELVGTLIARKAEFNELLHEFPLCRLPGGVLVRTLGVHGDTASVSQLWTWLSLELEKYAHGDMNNEHIKAVASWLADRPSLYRPLLAHGIASCAQTKHPLRFFDCEQRLYGAPPPAGQGDWYLELAAAATTDAMRRDLFDFGVRAHIARDGHTPTVLEHLLAWVAEHPEFEPNLQGWLSQAVEDWHHEHAQSRVERQAKDQERLSEWLHFFRSQCAAIESGTAPPKVMHDLAMTYFGRYREAKGNDPVERLRTFMQDDTGLVLATLAGLRRSLQRDDLPSVAEIAELHVKDRHHYIRTSCLAGAEEAYRAAPEEFLALGATLLQKLIAFRLSEDADKPPAWFNTLVAKQPKLVADVIAGYTAKLIKAGKVHVPGIYPLAYDASYAQVAAHAVPRLLEAFPVRAGKNALNWLPRLLRAALKHMERTQLADLVARKLALPRLDAAQRIDWLAAGLLLDSARYVEPLAHHAQRKEAYAWRLSNFFNDHGDRDGGLPPLTESAIVLLVRLLGPHCPSERPFGVYSVSGQMQSAELVRGLIARLGASTSEVAATGLEQHLMVKTLAPWHGDIRRAREAQRLAGREGRFRHAVPQEVVRTLENQQPANVADLAALAVAHLQDIARSDRNDNTLGYRRYWNIDKHQRPTTPRHEEDCRNRLLELLRERLRGTGVDAQPETRQADATRADIGLSFGGVGGLRLPIEIKRDRHRDLWTALRDQLIANYCRDPGADGHGIYLVFWFGGGKNMPPALDGGNKPRSAAELEARLTAQLGADERHRIAVIVIDCAAPQTA